jgi:UDP-N-acetylmuramoyl-tripeptide--D-alanyl-D-alanine ligase
VFPASCLAYESFRALPGPWLVVVDEHSLLPAVAHGTIVTFSLESAGDQTKLALAFNGANGHHFTFRRVSTGMAQNVVLAIALAHQLGVSDESIQRALAHWRPAQWRGEVRRDGPRTFYLDCYNANPASMADALDSFQAMTLREPRLYVLGCMEELGPKSEDYHRALGRTLRLRAEDGLFIIGDQAEALRQGVLESGSPAGRITIVGGLAPVTEFIAAFAGAVFLKGSRRYRLETALESLGAVAAH